MTRILFWFMLGLIAVFATLAWLNGCAGARPASVHAPRPVPLHRVS